MSKTFKIEQEGKTFRIDVPEGADANEALAQFTGAQITAVEPEEERTLGESVTRGLGLSGRLAFAPAKFVAGLSDLAAAGLNIPIDLISRADVALGGKPIGFRLPTTAREEIDRRITQIGFPEPAGFAEEFPQELAEFALPGGAAGATLAAPRTVQTAARADLPRDTKFVRSLADEIGEFFARKPARAQVAEVSAAGGAITAPEVVERAGGGPTAQTISSILGALIAGSPGTVVNLARRAADPIVGPLTNVGAERRVAARLQEPIPPAERGAAARAAETAPEGVPPAQAVGDEELLGIQARVLDEDPIAAARVETDLRVAEGVKLDEIAASFGPGTKPVDWQRRVVTASAPEGTTIKASQPDEMLGEAFKAFDEAYDAVKGIEVNPGAITATDAGVTLPAVVVNRVTGSQKLISAGTRDNVLQWLSGRFAQIERSATGTISSDNLLDFRHTVRQELRRKQKTAATNPQSADEAELLSEANRALTEILEKGLTAEQAAALRATDARYSNFKVVDDAVLRSGDKGLTSSALRTSLGQKAPRPLLARGELEGATGELATLQQQGVSPKAILNAGDSQQAARMVRDMTPAQHQSAKADFATEINRRATKKVDGRDRLKGDDLLNEINKNREVLTAAGFTPDDLTRMETLAREMQVIQTRSRAKAIELMNDDPGRLVRMMTMFTGARVGTNIFQRFFGRAGAGESLQAARFGSQELQKAMRGVFGDKADQILRDAMTNRELFAALMVRPQDTLASQAQAGRTISAWLAASAQEALPDEEE